MVEQRGSDDALAETGQAKLGNEVQAAPVVAIIDHRALRRDSLVRAIEDAGTEYLVEAFANLDEWLVDTDAPQRTFTIIINIGSANEDHSRKIDDLSCLKIQYPHINILALGEDEDPDLVVSVLASGAQGYLSMNLSVSVILGAIRLVQSGGVFVPADSLIRLHQQQEALAQPRDPTDGLLTAQQAKVAQALLIGKANKTIGYELNIHESTVKVHVRNIMRRLQARNRTEIAFKLHTWLQSTRRQDFS
ncbi:LuxR C-terminal-related transcriptional regulator [Inquilinus sp. NPDC058860]|uniref:LuxR C-terminal-related transcriptional regulator n=1 Tax=Inquilinus sp. NPDC058860 TaxID=3346652 RepID=UPI0036B540B0